MARAAKIAMGVLSVLGAMLILTTAGSMAASDQGPFDFGNPSFCDPSTQARDFGLSSLPPVHEIVESKAGAELDHPAVDIYGGSTHVMSHPEEWGYGFRKHDDVGAVPVDWTVTARLWAIDPEGKPTEEVGHTRRFLKAIDAAHEPSIGLTPPRPARFLPLRHPVQLTREDHPVLLVLPQARAAVMAGQAEVESDRRPSRAADPCQDRESRERTGWL